MAVGVESFQVMFFLSLQAAAGVGARALLRACDEHEDEQHASGSKSNFVIHGNHMK